MQKNEVIDFPFEHSKIGSGVYDCLHGACLKPEVSLGLVHANSRPFSSIEDVKHFSQVFVSPLTGLEPCRSTQSFLLPAFRGGWRAVGAIRNSRGERSWLLRPTARTRCPSAPQRPRRR